MSLSDDCEPSEMFRLTDMKIISFWDVMPYGSADILHSFGGTYARYTKDNSRKFLQNIGIYLAAWLLIPEDSNLQVSE
jgi:hypothetical protein